MEPIILNIGNTHVQSGRWVDGTIECVSCVSTAFFDPGAYPEDAPMAVACVVPETLEKLKPRKDLFVLDAESVTGVDFSNVDASKIGADRVANAVAAAKFAKLPVIVIDCGTALTIDVIDSGPTFRGGAIAPGRRILRKALGAFTAQLPEIGLDTNNTEAIGKNTIEAIAGGVDTGAIGMVREIVNKMKLELGVEYCQTIAVGGDAEFFCGNILDLSYGGKDFTLRGVALAWESIIK